MSFRLSKRAEQLADKYFPVGQKGQEYNGNIDQEAEVPEEINEEMEAKEMEGYTPGNDNLVINKNDNPGDKFGNIITQLKKLAILLNDQELSKEILSLAQAIRSKTNA